VADDLLFHGRRNPSRNIKPLAYGLAYQVQTVLQGDLLTRNVLNERYVLDEIKDGHAVREFTPQSAFNALSRRHSIPGKFTHHSSPHTGSTLSSSSACRPMLSLFSAPSWPTP
jgi:hypothetical protein